MCGDCPFFSTAHYSKTPAVQKMSRWTKSPLACYPTNVHCSRGLLFCKYTLSLEFFFFFWLLISWSIIWMWRKGWSQVIFVSMVKNNEPCAMVIVLWGVVRFRRRSWFFIRGDFGSNGTFWGCRIMEHQYKGMAPWVYCLINFSVFLLTSVGLTSCLQAHETFWLKRPLKAKIWVL